MAYSVVEMFPDSPLASAKGKNGPLLSKLNKSIAALRADGIRQQLFDRWADHKDKR
jgi:ABC-type amino acid transport substrate-binding protein